VERPLYERFQEAFTKRVAELRIGDPAAEDTQIGALNSLAHRDKVLGYIKLAETEGGTLLTGGGVPSLPAPFDRGAFLEPTVVDGLSTESRTATEEIFGPVVTLHPFDTEQEALEMANCTRYGLSASVWTQDLGRAHRVSKALDVGMVWVNTWLMRDLRVPFGGVKESGVGREGGRWSMEFFSETKNICIKVDPS
jgi:aminomuconate-semialdehyde/2-hydroxymuconate-6-semialdehyde dehydrogenase